MRKGFLEDLFLLFMTLLSALYFVVDMFDPYQTVRLLGFKPYVVTSPSMIPTIGTFDMVIVTWVEPDEIQVNDIITFKTYIPEAQGFATVTHYVREIIPDGNDLIFKTQGENRPVGVYDVWRNSDGTRDEVTSSDIIGRVAFTIPNIGLFIAAIRDPILLTVTLANIIILIAFIKYVRFLRRTRVPK